MNRDKIVEIFEVDPFNFNGSTYIEIHLSITHINFDKDGNKRSNFEVEQVIKIFIEEINGKIIEPDGIKHNLVFYAHTFVAKNGKKFKVAFNTENGKVHIRLITLYRKRKS
jgi:hypothetical protein